MVRKVFNIITSVVLVLLIVLVVMLFITRATGQTPALFGYRVFRVISDSMEPTLMVDDVILVKHTPAEDIHKDDIVTYISAQGQLEGRPITHRVIEEPEIKYDKYFFQTMGDREGAVPDPEISYDQIQGKFVRKLPFIDKMYSFFFTRYGIIAFIFVIVLLFGYEMISLIISYKSLDEHDDDYYAPPNKKPRHKRKK